MFLIKDKIKNRWERIESNDGLSTREKLDKLVRLSIKRKEKQPGEIKPDSQQQDRSPAVHDFSYPLNAVYRRLEFAAWREVTPQQLAVIFSAEEFLQLSPQQLLFFDTETTGLSGGAGTIPFLLGFGFFEEDRFKVRIFLLNDLSKEEEFLNEVDRFLESKNYCGVVTYNGKCFDYPIMETRYILYRKRFPLLKSPHLDFLFPARTLWKHSYESRNLGFLGDILLGLSRDEDIDASRIPAIYFDYLRSNAFALVEKVVEHNALDLVGLAALLLYGAKCVADRSFIVDEGELLGTAILYEKYGDLEKADELYGAVQESAGRDDIVARAIKRKAIIAKKKKLYDEARELWEFLARTQDRYAVRELSVHYEHREKKYFKALELVRRGLETIDLTAAQRADFEKRWERLNEKIKDLGAEPEE